MRLFVALLCAALFSGVCQSSAEDVSGADFEADPELRINQVQVIGTHNSYHIAPSEKVAAVIENFYKGGGKALDYTHRPLPEQLGRLGVRQIELDVFADTRGGLFAEPLGKKIAAGLGIDLPDHDPEGQLRQPSMKVLHVQDFDYLSTVLTLRQALGQVADWSHRHPRHFPILILLELKEEAHSPVMVKPEPFDAALLDALDAEILSVFKREEILRPDDVRGEFASLPEALGKRGWPTVREASGKVMFAMDNSGHLPRLYLKGHPALRDRLLFVSVDEADPAAAFLKLNDPVGGFEQIRTAVAAGFLVRTRADSGTTEARLNDTRRRERALASGAQFVSTDYPEPDERLSDYAVRLGAVTRRNPVSAPPIGD